MSDDPRRRWSRVTGSLVASTLVLAACGLVPGRRPVFDPERHRPVPVGPVHELGPVAVLGPEAGGGVRMLEYFRTRDGFCLRNGSGMSCQGGGDLPTGFGGFSASSGPDEACIETLAGKDAVRVEVSAPSGDQATLRPLHGSNLLPMNAFAVCWRPPVDVRGLTMRAFDQADNLVGEHPPRG